jgi:protein-L-isoaspartate(D-aspartate) O-methyltransferase
MAPAFVTGRRPRTAERAEERRAMVREIEAEALETVGWTGRSAFAPRVMAAMERVPRHEFVPASHAAAAYANTPLPIGHGQTISQPYVVALMTELAAPAADEAVLEVGTGCGYQTAVLAELSGRVYSVEVVPELAQRARDRLARLGYENVEVRTGDGWEGWPEHAPFDAIVVTAAADEVPPPLLDQLAPGGRLVIPVGSGFFGQELTVIERDAEGGLATRRVLPVRFVPLMHASAGGE